MDNLKITITDDTNKYNASNVTKAIVLGEFNLGDDLVPTPENDALENLCKAILALFPADPVKLDISYSISNH